MIIGLSTTCMYPEDLGLVLEDYGKRGVRDLEVFVNTFSELSDPFVRRMEEITDAYGMKIRAFHPFLSSLEPLMAFSGYEKRIDDLIDHYKRYFEIMQRFGAKIFVFHGDNKNSVRSVSFYAERLSRLRSAAQPYGIDVAQENICRCRSGDLGFLRALSAEMGDDISFVLDLKQAIRSGYDPFDVLSVMGEKTVHIHANDSLPGQDCLPPGKGSFDFSKLFGRLGEIGISPSVIVEVYRANFTDPGELTDAVGFLRSLSGAQG